MLTQAEPASLVVQLPTGVPGVNEVLGGGIPEYSCGLIAGAPGTGKTTLAHQILFANISAGRPGVYVSGTGPSTRKLLAQQQRFSFFEPEHVNRSIHCVNLAPSLADSDPAEIVDTVAREVEDRRVSVVVVDLVRALTSDALWTQLALYLARCEATAFMVGEYEYVEAAMDAAVNICDLALWLRRDVDPGVGATIRTLEAAKVRGQQALPGLHTVQLTPDGLHVYPRWPTPKAREAWG